MSAGGYRRTQKRLRSIALWTLCVVISLPVVLWAALYADSIAQRRKAERFVSDFGALTPGVSTIEDVRLILDRYSAPETQFDPPWKTEKRCTPTDCDYDFRVAATTEHIPEFLVVLVIAQHNEMKRIGLRLWGASARFEVRGGVLQKAILHLQFDGDHPAFRECYDVYVRQERMADLRDNFNADAPSYTVGKSHLTSGCDGFVMNIHLDNRASPDERFRAGDFRFPVLTRLNAQVGVSQFVPSAWEDWLEGLRKLEQEKQKEQYAPQGKLE